MNEVVRNQLNKKAPLVDPDELVDFIVSEILTEKARERGDSLWLRGSAVDPEKELDRKDKPSDLDVFLVVSDWDLPIADSSIVMCASEAPKPLVEKYGETRDVDDFELHNKEYWESGDRAWERLPEYARRSLVNSTQHFLQFRPEDKDENVVRNYDFRIGSREHVVEIYPSRQKVCDL